MKIREAIEAFRKQVPNNKITDEELIRWLDQTDRQVKQEIIDIRYGAKDVVFNGYTIDTDWDTELIVPSPYDDSYISYLKAKSYLVINDMVKYNVAMAMYNNEISNWRNFYNRKHRSLPVPLKF